jgi:hypothetical protein
LYIYLYETASTTGQYFVGAERQGWVPRHRIDYD